MRRSACRLMVTALVLALALGFVFSGTVLASEKKPYKIEIYTYKVGTFTYAMGVALADFINKQSTWLRATAIEATGASVTTRIVATDPGERGKIMGFMTRWEAETGYPPFTKPYHGIRDMAVIGFVTNGFVTLDPKIKTVKDFAGKRVGLGTTPSAARVDMPKAAILQAGVKNVTFSEFGFVDGVRALSDGLIDGLLSATFMRDAVHKKFGPNPALAQLMATKKVYFVSFDKPAYDIAHKKFEKKALPPWYSYTIPPGGLKGQTEPWVVQGGPITWSCDLSMPKDVVHEIVRIMGANTAGFGKYHPLGKSITPENMAKLGDESVVHPGALQYYKEKGIKIGSF